MARIIKLTKSKQLKVCFLLLSLLLLFFIAMPLVVEEDIVDPDDISVQVLSRDENNNLVPVDAGTEVQVTNWGLDQENHLVVQSESIEVTDEDGRIPIPPRTELEFVQVSGDVDSSNANQGTVAQESQPLYFGLDTDNFDIENVVTRGSAEVTVYQAEDQEEYIVYTPIPSRRSRRIYSIYPNKRISRTRGNNRLA